MKTIFSSPAGQDTALQDLARETKTSREEVLRVYRNELADLEAGARIRTFIPALALRRARAKLHDRLHPAVKR